ncbi:MAG: agmatinase [Deltaproteobacteria bacterium]|nr:agmatinase [Deltaproteobacteria bacterium]MBW2338728.1 agmatinase [Deltaproteobacteria bacterium]
MQKKKLNLPFTGITSFCKLPVCEEWDRLDTDVAVLGVPFDMSTQCKPGARYGPRGIREASAIYSLQDVGYYDHEFDEYFLEGVHIVDCGDVDMIHMDPQRCLQNAYDDAMEINSKNVLLVVMGGDHAVPVPVVRSLKDKGPLHIVQFDAHLDFVDERFGVREGHGNPMRRISEMEHVSGITQIGIRGPGSSSREDFDDARAYGSTIIGPREFRRLGAKGVAAKLPEKAQFYVTIDCDVLDPSLAPGTGSPSPGGLDYYELTDALRGVAAQGEVIGFDFCEVAPMYDPSGITCQVAARVILDFIGAIFKEKKKRLSLLER